MQSKFNNLTSILIQNRDYRKSEIDSVISMPHSKWQDFFHQSNIAYVQNLDSNLPSSTFFSSAFQLLLFAIALPLSISSAFAAYNSFANSFATGSLLSITGGIINLGLSYWFGNTAIDIAINIYRDINPNSTAFQETFSGQEIVTFYNKISHGMSYTEAESLLYNHHFSEADLKASYNYHDGDIAALIPSISLKPYAPIVQEASPILVSDLVTNEALEQSI